MLNEPAVMFPPAVAAVTFLNTMTLTSPATATLPAAAKAMAIKSMSSAEDADTLTPPDALIVPFVPIDARRSLENTATTIVAPTPAVPPAATPPATSTMCDSSSASTSTSAPLTTVCVAASNAELFQLFICALSTFLITRVFTTPATPPLPPADPLIDILYMSSFAVAETITPFLFSSLFLGFPMPSDVVITMAVKVLLPSIIELMLFCSISMLTAAPTDQLPPMANAITGSIINESRLLCTPMLPAAQRLAL